MDLPLKIIFKILHNTKNKTGKFSMNNYLLGLTITLAMLVSACNDTPANSCIDRDPKCDVGFYSCAAALYCYYSEEQCAHSNECP